MQILSLDIGGTKISSALIQKNGNVKHLHEYKEIQTPKRQNDINNADIDIKKRFKDALENLVLQYQGHNFNCIGVASTGIIKDGILSALNPDNLDGLDRFELQKTLHLISQKDIFALNDAQAAALAEYEHQHQSTKDGIKNFAFITISTGVGGGIVLNGKLEIGTNGLSGHIGHTFGGGNKICGCKRIGCVESIASGRAISDLGKEILQKSLSAKEIFALWHQGDKKAADIINISAKTIANLIADLKISLDITYFSIGGSIGLADGYLELVAEHINQMPSIYRPKINKAFYAKNAGLIGAALYALS
ncbi:MAG: N-acetylmannosamine kinase [Helicobacter sp.]|nr:N-acetylmannosamine kinase [Helicobacter sp.]